MSPATETAEQPAVEVDTGTGPSDNNENVDSDQFYEIMESLSIPLIMTKVNTTLCSSKEKMIRDEQTTVGGHIL